MIPSQPNPTINDIKSDRYQELRRPKIIWFQLNGDEFFPGISLSITPNRFFTLDELYAKLTQIFSKRIPCGVRQIFDLKSIMSHTQDNTIDQDEKRQSKALKTPSTIYDLEQLEHGHTYVCAGNEKFRPVNYGLAQLLGDSSSRAQKHNHEVNPKFFYVSDMNGNAHQNGGDGYPPNDGGHGSSSSAVGGPNSGGDKNNGDIIYYRGQRLYPLFQSGGASGGEGNSTGDRSPHDSPRQAGGGGGVGGGQSQSTAGNNNKNQQKQQQQKPSKLQSFTVVQGNSEKKPREQVKVLLSRNAVTSLAQLTGHIADAFQVSNERENDAEASPGKSSSENGAKSKTPKIKKLFAAPNGDPIESLDDFFLGPRLKKNPNGGSSDNSKTGGGGGNNGGARTSPPKLLVAQLENDKNNNGKDANSNDKLDPNLLKDIIDEVYPNGYPKDDPANSPNQNSSADKNGNDDQTNNKSFPPLSSDPQRQPRQQNGGANNGNGGQAGYGSKPHVHYDLNPALRARLYKLERLRAASEERDLARQRAAMQPRGNKPKPLMDSRRFQPTRLPPITSNQNGGGGGWGIPSSDDADIDEEDSNQPKRRRKRATPYDGSGNAGGGGGRMGRGHPRHSMSDPETEKLFKSSPYRTLPWQPLEPYQPAKRRFYKELLPNSKNPYALRKGRLNPVERQFRPGREAHFPPPESDDEKERRRRAAARDAAEKTKTPPARAPTPPPQPLAKSRSPPPAAPDTPSKSSLKEAKPEEKAEEKKASIDPLLPERNVTFSSATVQKDPIMRKYSRHHSPSNQNGDGKNNNAGDDDADDDENDVEKSEPPPTYVLPSHRTGQTKSDEPIKTQYKLGPVIGRGNFADVYSATRPAQPIPGAPIANSGPDQQAVKAIDKRKTRNAWAKQKNLSGAAPSLSSATDPIEVQKEVYILANCDHPNIIRLHQQLETSNYVYLATDIYPEGDLFDLIKRYVKFEPEQAAPMIRDLFLALHYLHSCSIIHRDVKPENLLVRSRKSADEGGAAAAEYSLVLGDFGLATEFTGVPLYLICGTPTYVAPEILKGSGYGMEVDEWAAGVILYILLCGFPPFRSLDRGQTELFEFIKHGEFEFVSPYWDRIGPSPRKLITALLSSDPRHRFKSAQALMHPWIMAHAKTFDNIRDVLNLEEDFASKFNNRKIKYMNPNITD